MKPEEHVSSRPDAVTAYQQQTDDQLLHAAAQGSELAFATLYDRHAQVAYNLIVRIVRDERMAEDVLQEAFWQVWHKASSYRGNGSVAAWVYRIARNKGLDKLRYVQRRRVTWQPLPLDSEGNHVEHGNQPEEQIARKHLRQDILLALAEMPVEQRHCLELAYFEGLSQREIAAQTQTPLGTVKTRIRSGLKKLGASLRAIGYGNEDG